MRKNEFVLHTLMEMLPMSRGRNFDTGKTVQAYGSGTDREIR